MIPHGYDAAIFDMDGTIVDSLGIWEKIDRMFLEEKRGIKVPRDYVHAIAAMSFREIAEYTIKRFGLSDTPEALMQEWTEMAVHEYTYNIGLKPFAEEYLRHLKENGMKIALCTSSPTFFCEPVLKSNGIYDVFDAFATTCDAGIGKNSPEVFLLAAQRVGVTPDKCIVFEDTVQAAESAKKAGMAVCGVYDDRNRDIQERLKAVCDYYVMGFHEIMEDR